MVGTRGVHQQQAVAGGCGVEHDEGRARLIDHAAEGVEHRHLLGAGRLQVLQQQGPALFVEVLAARGHDLVDVGGGLGLRVDAADLEAVQAAAQRLGHVGRWVGGGQVHAVATLHQADRQRGGDGGLAHAALAHDHDQPVTGRGQFVGQRGQRAGRQFGGARGGHDVRRRAATEQRTQRGQADGVEGPQRHLIARECGQRPGQLRQRLAAQGFDGRRHAVGRIAGVEHAVDGQPLVRQPELSQLVRGARGFLHGAWVGPRDQHYGGERRVAQGPQRGIETRLLHLQPRMRPQAGGAAVVACQETAPGLGQAEQAQGVAGGRGVEDHMIELPVRRLTGQQRGELVEGGDLGGAGARELLAHRCALLVAGARLQLRQHALAVGLGGAVGVDVEHLQPRHARHRHRLVGQRDPQHLVEVGGGVGADQQHAPAGVGQRDGGGGGQRGFAHPALAREEQVAGGIGGETGQGGV